MNRRPDQVRRRGVAIIEMAIVLPLLLLLLLGGLDFGLQYHVRHVMVNAAREAARALAVQGASGADVKTKFETQLRSTINAPFTVTPTLPGAGETDVKVTISVPRAEVTLGMFGTPGGTIEVQTTMRKEE